MAFTLRAGGVTKLARNNKIGLTSNLSVEIAWEARFSSTIVNKNEVRILNSGVKKI